MKRKRKKMFHYIHTHSFIHKKVRLLHSELSTIRSWEKEKKNVPVHRTHSHSHISENSTAPKYVLFHFVLCADLLRFCFANNEHAIILTRTQTEIHSSILHFVPISYDSALPHQSIYHIYETNIYVLLCLILFERSPILLLANNECWSWMFTY